MIASADRAVSGVDNRLFWEKKAPKYGLPFDSETLSRTIRIIGILEEKGISLKGVSILDIGCGTGTLALPLAQRGSRVTALDISENMLIRLWREAEKMDIEGVQLLRHSWKEVNVRDAGLEKAFDVVLSALSIAVETEADILKMERCAKTWCVCIATERIRRDPVCDRVLKALKAPRKPRPYIRDTRLKLAGMGRSFSYGSLNVVTTTEKTAEQLIDEIAQRFEAAGKAAHRNRIEASVMAVLSENDKEKRMIRCRRESEIGVLMWRVDRIGL
ncbi:MAG: Cypemycin methyltransferase [Syntrophorhabdaceae bacterium PtaU1.Bin034]|nr:MAG: Cypemycin methyltransferase [Syntrophorhabdaceae bacterium PtaU1.Bin034]